MSHRQRLARERLEIYLVHLLLMYRRMILMVGLLCSVCAVTAKFVDRIAGFTSLFLAIFLLLLGNSFLEIALSLNVPLPSGMASYLEVMHAVETDQQRDTSNWQRMCHNDLVSVNYIYLEKAESIVVLD